jgi:hypothetical protein
MAWVTYRSIFSQSHLVTLIVTRVNVYTGDILCPQSSKAHQDQLGLSDVHHLLQGVLEGECCARAELRKKLHLHLILVITSFSAVFVYALKS